MPQKKPPQTVFVKYTGDYKASTFGVGSTVPGEVIELPAEFGTKLATSESLFELAEAPKPIKESVKEALKEVV